MKQTVLIAAGGSGGHVLPAITVANEIQALAPDVQIVFVGAGRPLEVQLLAATPFPLRTIPFRGFLGAGVAGKLRLLLSLPLALWRGFRLFRELRPGVVLGFGAYPSIIPVVIAFLLRVPRMIYQQDIQAGVANRNLSRIASRVFGPVGAQGFPDSVAVQHIGVPLRPAFAQIAPYVAPRSGEPVRLLVIGGSQGASAINNAVLAALSKLSAYPLEIRHQTGVADSQAVADSYRSIPGIKARVEAFIDDVAGALADAHLVISRAGVGSSEEILASGRPAIFVPLPSSAGHQRHNVEEVARVGSAVIVAQDSEFESQLYSVLERLLQHPEQLGRMAEQTAKIRDSRPNQSPARVLAESALRLMMSERP